MDYWDYLKLAKATRELKMTRVTKITIKYLKQTKVRPWDPTLVMS